VRKFIALNKRRFVSPEDAGMAAVTSKDYREKALAEVYAEYERQLKADGVLDYDSLIYEAYKLLAGNPEILAKYQERCEHLQVDEFQDTSPAEQKFSILIASKAKSFVAVGDFFQSIYGFRGANCTAMLDFGKWFPKHDVAYLSRNFRSTKNVIDAFRRAAPDTTGPAAALLLGIATGNGAGKPPTSQLFIDKSSESDWIFKQLDDQILDGDRRCGDFAILARTNRQLRPMEDLCIQHGFPYSSPGCGFYGRTEVRLALAFLRLVEDPNAIESRLCECRKGDCGKCKDGYAESWAGRTIARSGLDCVRYLVPYVVSSLELKAAEIAKETGGKPKPYEQLMVFADPRKNVERALWGFYDLIETLRSNCVGLPVHKQLELIYHRTRLIDWLRRNEEIDEGDNGRADNILELVEAAKKFETRAEFLNHVAETDKIPRREGGATRRLDAITLSTVHRAKGKEWNVVFVSGLTDGLFPHKDGDKDEEARLLYVAISRAKEEVYLTGHGKPAPFLAEELAAVAA
jgi:DNA helicase-2/ATP-dependent DNA helicase PcrA